jgi:hypothetical protein
VTDDTGGVPSRDVIAAWSPQQRDEVARILDELTERPDMRVNRGRRLLVLLITCGGAVALIPWIVHLNATLPSTSSGGAWRTAWVGYDLGLVAVLACAGWMALRRRMLVLPLLTMAATLLVVDTWFDITLSWGTSEQLTSILTAAFVEVPIAGFLLAIVWLLLSRIVSTVAALRGYRDLSIPLRRAPIVMLMTTESFEQPRGRPTTDAHG